MPSITTSRPSPHAIIPPLAMLGRTHEALRPLCGEARHRRSNLTAGHAMKMKGTGMWIGVTVLAVAVGPLAIPTSERAIDPHPLP
jgi:hypothetical protein